MCQKVRTFWLLFLWNLASEILPAAEFQAGRTTCASPFASPLALMAWLAVPEPALGLSSLSLGYWSEHDFWIKRIKACSGRQFQEKAKRREGTEFQGSSAERTLFASPEQEQVGHVVTQLGQFHLLESWGKKNPQPTSSRLFLGNLHCHLFKGKKPNKLSPQTTSIWISTFDLLFQIRIVFGLQVTDKENCPSRQAEKGQHLHSNECHSAHSCIN